MAILNNILSGSVQEDFDAGRSNGVELLHTSGFLADSSLDPRVWSIASITRTEANYTGEARGAPGSELYPEQAVGSLTASVTNDGLQWQWQAPNRAFNWMENNRSVSEDWSFVSREEYVVTLENRETGAVRTETVSVDITGNSDETFDVLILGADSAPDGAQRVADNLVATGLIDTVAVAGFADIASIDTRFVDAIFVYTNDAPADAVQVGDFLKTYVDTTNGGVVIGNYAFNQSFALAGGIMGDGYASFNAGPAIGSPTGVGSQIVPMTGAAGDAIFAGIDLAQATGAFFRNENLTNPTVDADALLLATDQNGVPLIARSESGRVISTNFFPRDLGSSNLGPNGESLLTPGEQEFYELLVNSLYDASANPLFAPPSAEDLTERARTEIVRDTAFGVFEAEDALFSAGMLVQSGRNASGGEFLDFPSSNTPLEVSWTIDVEQAGYYAVDFVYALPSGKRPLSVLIDGEVADVLPFLGNSNSAGTLWAPQSMSLELSEGRHTITLLTPSGRGIGNGANLDYMRISDDPVSATFVTTPSSGVETVGDTSFVKYEAEAAVLSDQLLLATGRGASGNVFVDFPTFDEPLTVAWTVEVASDGAYGVEFLYALSQAKADRPLLVTVDGDFVDTLDFEGMSNGAESQWGPERIVLELEAGAHVIQLTSLAGAGTNNGANLDYMRVTQEPLADYLANASSESEALLL